MSQKLAYAFDFFDKYTEISICAMPKDTVSQMIVELDYFDRILSNGKIADANLLSSFLDMLNTCPYADTLHSFLKYIEDGGDKCVIKPEDDCVNIMTMHASKGLEFPFVYVVNTEDNKGKSNSSFLPAFFPHFHFFM